MRLPRSLSAIVDKPSWPGTMERATKARNLGVDYDTSWARTPLVRVARSMLIDGVTAPLTRLATSPEISGLEHLDPLDGPVIFVANHTSHLDTAVILSSLPEAMRRKTVVAAAADHFFDRKWKAGLWAFLLGTIPVERTRVHRRSTDLAAELILDGWNLVIFPEGGRTPDGWGQEFHPASAGYLAKRCNAPVVPIHLRGVRPIFPKGSGRLRPGKVEIRIGDALRPIVATDGGRDEDARRFSVRIEAAVAQLADEAETDWWSARQRAAAGQTPPFRGPEAAPWRRSWSLPDSARTVQVEKKRKRLPW